MKTKFQDNSRTFYSFQGLNFIDFQSIFDCFCRKRRFRNGSHFIFITGIFYCLPGGGGGGGGRVRVDVNGEVKLL